MKLFKPIYLVSMLIVLIAIVGYLTINQNLGGVFRTPTPTNTATPTLTPTFTATATFTLTATYTATPTNTPTSTPTNTPIPLQNKPKGGDGEGGSAGNLPDPPIPIGQPGE